MNRRCQLYDPVPTRYIRPAKSSMALFIVQESRTIDPSKDASVEPSMGGSLAGWLAGRTPLQDHPCGFGGRKFFYRLPRPDTVSTTMAATGSESTFQPSAGLLCPTPRSNLDQWIKTKGNPDGSLTPCQDNLITHNITTIIIVLFLACVSHGGNEMHSTQ